MRHLRSAILLALAIFAGQSLAAPVATTPPQTLAKPVMVRGKRDFPIKHARPERQPRPASMVKTGSRVTAPSVKGVVADDFKMNTDSLPMFLYRDGLAAVTLEDGNFLCAWADYRDGNMNIRFQRFTPAGQPASAVFTADARRDYKTQPCLAVRSNGAFAVSWLANDDIGYQHVFCRAFDPSGNPLDTAVKVDDLVGQSVTNPAIAATDSGFVVGWSDSHTGDWRAYLQMLDTLGQLVGLNFPVSTPSSSQRMNLAMIRAGQGFVAAWSDNNNGVRARRYDAWGDTIGPEFQANSASTNIVSRPVLCATDSGFTIAWDDYRNWSNNDIYFQRFDTAGTALGGNINVTNFSYNAEYSSIASRNGQTVVAWQDERSGNKDVYAQWYKPNGDTLGGQAMLNDDTTSYDQQRPVALAGDSGWTLCWLDGRHYDNTVIYGQSYDTSLAAQGANVMLSDSTVGLQYQEYPSVAAGENGNFLAVWDDCRNNKNSEDVYGRLYSNNGVALTLDFPISDTSYSPSGRSAYVPKVKGLADGSYIVAWYDYRNGSDYDIYGQRLDASGSPIGGNYLISTTGPGYNDYDLSIAAFDSGYGVFWYSYDPGWSYSNIYGRIFKINGDSIGTTKVINDTVSQSYYPSAAANDSGIMIMWQDYRDDNYYHIYGQRMLWDGSLVGGNYLVGDSLDNDQNEPSIAGTNSGYMVTWYNYYSDSAAIAGQRLDAAGQPVDTNFAVSTESGLYHECPSVAVSPDGDRYAVLWYTWTGSKYILLSQRYQNGLPQGVNELLVDTTAWIDAETYGAQSIAATNDRLFFPWYGYKDYRRTGYDVYGKVTDWYATALPPAVWVDSLPDDIDSAYGPYSVKAKITDDGSVDQAVLYYRINGGAWDTLTMAAGAADTFAAVIPEQFLVVDDTFNISYYVWALDDTKNFISSPARSFKLTYPNGVAGNPGNDLPKVYTLQACYPNPSSGRVSFGYRLPKTSKVSLTVYNIAGQAVKRFDLGAQPAGQHRIDWNGNQVAAGVYFYSLQAGDFSSTKKLMIIR
jgi:hypothetical protein